MNTNKKNTILRFFMIIVVMAVLLGLTGGLPAAVTAKEASYIIQAANADIAASLTQSHGGLITSRLEIINAVAANLTEAEAAQLKQEAGVIAVTPNGEVNSSDDGNGNENNGNDNNNGNGHGNGVSSSTGTDNGTTDVVTDYPNVVGADVVWQKGFTGEGITVAVLDTGISSELPQLNNDVYGNAGRIVAWKDFIENTETPIDPNGHGSHVAGIIANSEKGADGDWNGVAPGVNLAGVRVLDQTGAGTYESVINGMQWVYQNADRYHIKVVNLSLVAPVQSAYFADPLDMAVTALWARGLTVVVAAGNTGPGPMTISVPGNNPYAITVGAFTDNYTPFDWSDDYLAPFSGSGPTLDGFVKPDVVAPGGHIVSVVPTGSYLAAEYPANNIGANYFKIAGTSMSSAVVSGIAALILDRNNDLTNDQVKNRLTINAMPWLEAPDLASYSMFQQGFGRVNAPDAVFSNSKNAANADMNVRKDLAGAIHYQGNALWDESTQTFHLKDPFADWNDGYAAWDGKAGAWSGKAGAWSGTFGTWTGKAGAWSGKAGAWSGKAGAWSGKAGAWSGKAGAWSGKAGAWSGKAGAWSGKAGAWSGKAGAWSGGYTTWTGKAGAWSGKAGAWSGKAGAWSGSEDTYSGKAGAWSGKAGAWSGKAGAWSGKAGAWSGKAGAWSGKAGAWSGAFLDDPAFSSAFAAGLSPDTILSVACIDDFIIEP